MATIWSNDVALNNDEMFCVGIDTYLLSENNYQATIRADVYVSTWLYASSTYNFYVNIGLHTSTKELRVDLKDGKYQLVATWDVTVTKENSGSYGAYCRAYAGCNGLNTNTVGKSLTISQGYWHYVAYDLNGGKGSFATQVKFYGFPITLHSGKPTKENYTFEGWEEPKTSEVLPAGGYYGYDMRGGTNTLTAQWKIVHNPPTVALTQPFRVESADATVESVLGTYVRVPVDWSLDQTGYISVGCASITATVIADGGTEVTDVTVSGTCTGTAGTAYVVFPLGISSYATVTVTVTETATVAPETYDTYETSASVFVGKAHAPLDIANKGNSVAILSTAGEEDSIVLGALTMTGVNPGAVGSVDMPTLLGFVDALNNTPRTSTIQTAASGMYCQAFESAVGVHLGANSTGTTFSSGSTVCRVYTANCFANRGKIFIRGVFHGHQSGIYAAYGTDGHTITITTEQALTLSSQNTMQAFIPCRWTIEAETS